MRRLIAALLALLVLGGCSYYRQVRRSSNLMSYLYPDRMEAPPPNPNVRLQLPLRIGIAFVPPEPVHARYSGDFRSVFPPDSEGRLLSIVKKAFQGRDWVGDVVVIPSSFLTQRGGFENLDQVAQLMNVDVIALTSLDQLQVSNPRRASFLYVSVIGAYLLPLDRNQTRTLIDAAVFHVPSRTLLLNAPGISSISGSSTAMDIEAKLDERSLKGFELAMQDLAKNLNHEVDRFKASVASGERKDVDIVTREGKSVRGGGAFAWWDAIVVGLLLALIMRKP
jgi:rhombotail lipoprotein